MGHMAAMAQMCKFMAMHGTVKKETEEEKAKRLEEEKAVAKHNAKIRAERKSYLEFWIEKYAEISDDSAIKNFEYALANVDNHWTHIMYGDTWAKDIRSKLRYPDLHCDALMNTHRDVLWKHAKHLQNEAFYGDGYYIRPNITPERRNYLNKIGRVCNWWFLGEGWRGC